MPWRDARSIATRDFVFGVRPARRTRRLILEGLRRLPASHVAPGPEGRSSRCVLRGQSRLDLRRDAASADLTGSSFGHARGGKSAIARSLVSALARDRGPRRSARCSRDVPAHRGHGRASAAGVRRARRQDRARYRSTCLKEPAGKPVFSWRFMSGRTRSWTWCSLYLTCSGRCRSACSWWRSRSRGTCAEANLEATSARRRSVDFVSRSG